MIADTIYLNHRYNSDNPPYKFDRLVAAGYGRVPRVVKSTVTPTSDGEWSKISMRRPFIIGNLRLRGSLTVPERRGGQFVDIRLCRGSVDSDNRWEMTVAGGAGGIVQNEEQVSVECSLNIPMNTRNKNGVVDISEGDPRRDVFDNICGDSLGPR